ncbi:MAG: threonine/serine dehydratase [Proteobacteria bacterium]|nr:threonine/serine dehydratase [Pseudomonadota bacterium]
MNSSPESTAEPLQASPPSFADVEAAAGRLAGHAVATPLLSSPALDRRVGGRVLLKAETLQRTGSFKFRGAYNRISQIPEDARPAGVVAYSSGNHAQGVAAAAALLGVPATIVMPEDAPAIKLANTRGYGAEVVLYDRFTEVREEICAEIAARRGATIVRPFDDPAIIAGQGTCGLEIARQAAALDAELDAVLICCGGGGLTAGCALALAELSPRTAIYTVEPEAFDDTARSLAAGARVANDPAARSFCDALLAPTPGELTFAINRRLVTGGLSVGDAEVAAAMAYAFRTLKLVVEPGGAVALAALLSGRLDARGKTVALTLSGANVDPQTYREVLGRENVSDA